MSSGHRNIKPINENYPMTDEQQSQQPHPGVASITDVPPAIYHAIREQVTRDVLSQLQLNPTILQNTSQNVPQNVPQSISATPPATQFINSFSKTPTYQESTFKKASEWPFWNGDIANFNAHAWQLQIKIEENKDISGPDRAIYLNIFRSIATDRQPRILHWFETGGPKGDYNWQSFLDHVKEQYEDKQTRLTASNLLHRMRMDANQYFTDYLQDFELKLSQSGKTGLDDSTKISQLDTGINSSLRKLLFNKSLPENDYNKWVTKVRTIAGRLKNIPSYRPNGCAGTKTWYIPQNGLGQHVSTVTSRKYNESAVDGDGDTRMGGVNSLRALITAINALGSNQADRGQEKNSANWKSSDKFKRLFSEGRFIRCERKGHKTRFCPNYGPAKRPTKISHVKSSTLPDLEKILAEIKRFNDPNSNIDNLEKSDEENISREE